MALNDHRTQAQLRILLIQEWVDLSKLEYCVVNGVVFFGGELRPRYSLNGATLAEENISLVTRLEDAAKTLPGVSDVVFSLSNLTKNGEGWETK